MLAKFKGGYQALALATAATLAPSCSAPGFADSDQLFDGPSVVRTQYNEKRELSLSDMYRIVIDQNNTIDVISVRNKSGQTRYAGKVGLGSQDITEYFGRWSQEIKGS